METRPINGKFLPLPSSTRRKYRAPDYSGIYLESNNPV